MTETEVREALAAVRVHIVEDSTKGYKARPEEFEGTLFNTVVLTPADPIQVILPAAASRLIAHVQALDYDIVLGRSKGQLGGALNTAGTGNPSIEADGFTTAPVKNTPWVFLTVPPGVYNVEWTIWLGGTLAAANDADNMALITSNNVNSFVAQGVSPGVAGYYPQQPVQNITVLPGQAAGHYFAVQAAPNNATAASVYGAQIIATPVQKGSGTPTPSGLIVPASNTAPWPVRDKGVVYAATTVLAANNRVSVAAVYRGYSEDSDGIPALHKR